MSKPSKRNQQVSDLVRRKLSWALRQEINDPRLHQLTITDVVLSPDLRHAKVYFMISSAEHLPEVQKALRKAAGHLRHIIASSSELRYTPALMFYYDETLAHAEHLSFLLKKMDEKNSDDHKK